MPNDITCHVISTLTASISTINRRFLIIIKSVANTYYFCYNSTIMLLFQSRYLCVIFIKIRCLLSILCNHSK